MVQYLLFWNVYYFIFQILACDCNEQGSNGTTCNANGACSCKANIVNNKCDACAAGYFNFPTCEGKHYLQYLLTHIAFMQLS